MQYWGKFRGTVANNVDPLGLGRVQITVPSVLGDSRLSWAMPCVPYAGAGVGFLFIPPVDAEIWVEFEGGDPEYPVWVGGFWTQSGDVPASPQIPQMKVLKTDNFTLTVRDGPGPAEATIETEAGLKIVIGPTAISIDTGAQGVIKLEGPKVSINGSALEVT